MYELERQIRDALPRDHSRQSQPASILPQLLRDRPGICRVLDVGCGEGDSIALFRGLRPDIDWVGVDIEDSPEVRARRRSDSMFHSFNGVQLPFPDSDFDLLYSNQVLEHVRFPGPLLRDCCRVLRPGGLFLGSVSHLEPYHSYSICNFTPWGAKLYLEDAGLKVIELRPGIDALTLIARRLLGRPAFFRYFFHHESPLNALIGMAGRLRRARHDSINVAKLLYCGVFSFLAERPVE